MRDIIVILTNADNVISRREMNGQLFRTSMKMALRHFSKQPLPHTVSSGMDFPRKPPQKCDTQQQQHHDLSTNSSH